MMENLQVCDYDDRLAATQLVDNRILKNVIAYVEVRTTNDNRSEAVRRELELLGATVVKKFTNDVTHVVFKEGSNRTKTKAQKLGIHFVSVLWVDSCKQNQEHVSERMYPAIIPKQKGPNLFIAKLKKAKSMQPRDFEEEVSRSAERLNRKKRRIEALDRLRSAGNTPHSSPRSPLVLVQDTQPRSPDDGFILTPIRLTIPDTPPSMREKLKQLRIGKEGPYMKETGADDRIYSKDMHDKEPLQRKLFRSSGFNLEALSSFESPGANSVFTSEDESKDMTGETSQQSDNEDITDMDGDDENPAPTNRGKRLKSISEDKDVWLNNIAEDENEQEDGHSSHIAREESESSVTDDILGIASKISATFNKKASLDDSLDITSDDNFGTPHHKLDLPVDNDQSNKLKHSKKKEINIKGSGEGEQSTASDSSVNSMGKYETNDSEKSKKKSKVSCAKTKVNRRKSRRISLQNTVDTNENEDAEDKGKSSPETVVSDACPSHVTTSVDASEVALKEEMNKKKSNPENETLEKQRIQRVGAENITSEKQGTVETNKERIVEKLAHSSASNSACSGIDKDDCDIAYLHTTVKDDKTSKVDRRRTHSDIEVKAMKIKSISKRKLLSLTDLNEPQSVLIEPSKCSDVERSELVDKKPNGRRVRKKKENTKRNDIDYNATVDTNDGNIQSDLTKTFGKDPKNSPDEHDKLTRDEKVSQKMVVSKNSVETDDKEISVCREGKDRKRRSKLFKASRLENDETKNVAVDRCPGQGPNGIQMTEYESRGRKRKSKPCNAEIAADGEFNKPTGSSSQAQKQPDPQPVEKENGGRKRKSKTTRTRNSVSSPKHLKTEGADQSGTAKTAKKLVNDTILTDKVNDLSNTSQLNDITTQLNLTTNNSVTASLRDGTLSLSLSTVYNPDTTVQSILLSQRKSIDEFSISQKTRNKINSKSLLKPVKEGRKNSHTSSSDSDNSVCGKPRKAYRPSLVMTSLHSHEQDVVISVVKKLGGFVISENVNETTTHVVCGEPRRTLNVLNCVARGAWLVNKSWVLKSLEAGSWIPEEEFECHQFFPVCKVARLEREESEGYYKPKLFSTVGPVYVSGRSTPPRQHIVQLIKLCGGQITGVLNKASLYIGSDFHPNLTCLKPQWILECITQHRLLPLERFSLDQPKREASPVY